MKKFLAVLIAVVMVGSIISYSLLGVELFSDDGDVEILRVYNWEEYISESDENKISWGDYISGEYELVEDDEYIDVIYLFESYCKEVLGKNVKVEYSTFGTNENMYNELNLSKKTVGDKVTYSYDLVCPSEYMLLKMLREDMLEPLDGSILTNYSSNVSSYIGDLFKKQIVERDGVGYSLYDYATCYMWGTMGYVYNPEKVDPEDAKHWSLLWDDRYVGQGTIKDSVRDSYILALGYCFEEELQGYKALYDRGELSREEYNKLLTSLYNRTDGEAVSKAGKALTDLKDRIYGYEVDSGKKEMAQGKISINFAWSGDAVYTMDVAEEDGTLLSYAIPEEGSNIFFDGWAMPKGANKALAQEFINFMSRTDIGQMNMGYIGYTSALAGEEMFANAVDWYGTYVLIEADAEDEDTVLVDGKYYYEEYFGDLDEATAASLLSPSGDGTYDLIYPEYDEDYNVVGASKEEGVELYFMDLSYFFNTVDKGSDLYDKESFILVTDEYGRQAFTQYPTEDMVARCTVMKCFTDEEIRVLNDMWETAKIGNVNFKSLIITIAVILAAILVAVAIVILYKKDVIKRVSTHKNWKLVEKGK